MPNNRTLLLAMAATCFALVGAALYLQHAKDMLPCPLCVIQRYAFLAAGIFSLVAAFANKQKLWAGLALVGALGGPRLRRQAPVRAGQPRLLVRDRPDGDLPQQDPDRRPACPGCSAPTACAKTRATPLLGLSIPQWSARLVRAR